MFVSSELSFIASSIFIEINSAFFDSNNFLASSACTSIFTPSGNLTPLTSLASNILSVIQPSFESSVSSEISLSISESFSSPNLLSFTYFLSAISENLILKISTLAEKIPNLVPVSVSSVIRACSLVLKASSGVSEYFSIIASLILIVSGASLRLFFLLISCSLSFSIIFLLLIDFGILLANFDPENKF